MLVCLTGLGLCMDWSSGTGWLGRGGGEGGKWGWRGGGGISLPCGKRPPFRLRVRSRLLGQLFAAFAEIRLSAALIPRLWWRILVTSWWEMQAHELKMVGFIGGGKMAQAIARGFISSGKQAPRYSFSPASFNFFLFLLLLSVVVFLVFFFSFLLLLVFQC